MNFKDFLTEAEQRSQPINLAKTAEILTTQCSNILSFYKANPNLRFYRGLGFMGFAPPIVDSNYYFVDPKNSAPRRLKASSGQNVKAITSISKSWKLFPQRDTSIVFSTGRTRAMFFSNDKNLIYVVLPVNGATFGVCGNYDFNFSSAQYPGSKQRYSLNGIARFIQLFCCYLTLENCHEFWDRPMLALQNADFTIKKDKGLLENRKFLSSMKNVGHESLTIYFIKLLKTHDLLDAFEMMIRPDAFTIALAHSPEQVYNIAKETPVPVKAYDGDVKQRKNEREVWTDSAALLIRPDAFDKILKNIK